MTTTGTRSTAAEVSPPLSLLLVAPLLVLLTVVYLAPIAALLPQSVGTPGFDPVKYTRILREPLFQIVFLRTFRIAAEVTALVILIGYPTAYFIWRARPALAAVLLTLVLFPLWTSVLVRTYAWTAVLARNGVVNALLEAAGLVHDPIRFLNTEFAVLIGMVHVLVPFAILPIYSALRRIDPLYPLASASLGAPSWKTFVRVILPLSFPGTLAAAVIVFILALGFYVTPAILGGPRAMMVANLMDQQVNYFLDFGQCAALAVVLLGVTLGLVALVYRLLDVERLLREGT